jgi:hypothetical protein
MNKWSLLLGVAALGVAGYFAYTMFAKKGESMFDFDLNALFHKGSAALGGYDDPYKYYAEDPDAWDPTSKRYKEITSRSSKKQKEDKKKQIDYIESYMANAYGI